MRSASPVLLLCAALIAACATHSVSGTPASASAAPESAAKPPLGLDLPVQKFVLPNGLTLIVHEDHKAPVVALDVWYHVGSKDEPTGRHGFAHLFEHLMFKGSGHRKGEYFAPLEPAGATEVNGTTSYDRTNFFETVPTSAFDLALWMESDRMGYLSMAIDQADLDEQRGVVENEKRQDENQPYGDLDDHIAEGAYPAGHPYSWTPIGSENDLNHATLTDVKDWFRQYYGAANATLVISGDIDTAVVRQKVQHYFGHIPAGEPVSHVRRWVAPIASDRTDVLHEDVPLPRLSEVWNVAPAFTRDEMLLEMAAQVLGGRKTSRLEQRLIYHDQTAAAASADVDDRELGSQFNITITLRPGGDIDVVQAAAEQELNRFLADGPTDEELERVRTGVFASLVRGLEGVGGSNGQADLLARSTVLGGSPDAWKQQVEWMRTASAADVRDAARRWLSGGRYRVQVVPPERYRTDIQDADRTHLPAIGAPPELHLPPLQRASLSNGLQIVLAERHDVPAVQFQLIVPGGMSADAAGKSGVSRLMFDMMEEGSDRGDSLAIGGQLESLGALFDGSVDRDSGHVAMSAVKPRLADSLSLYADLIRHPTFPQHDLDRLKKQVLAGVAEERAAPGGAVRRVMSRLLFGAGHPYAFAGTGLPAEIEAISRDDLVNFYQRWIRPDNAVLLVVGDTTLNEIKPMLESNFGDWTAPSSARPTVVVPSVPVASRSRVFLIDKPGSAQSLVAAAELAPPPSDPAEPAYETVNTVVGGMFTSRLNMKLRQEKHWSYGAFSDLVMARHRQIFIAEANVERDHTADSVVEMHRDFRELVSTHPLQLAEVSAAKLAEVRGLPGQNETLPDIAGSYTHILTYGLPEDYYNQLVGRIGALQLGTLQAAAKQLVLPEQLTWVIVGDLSKIEHSVRALNLGEVQVIDADGNRLR
jgi:zinc protease